MLDLASSSFLTGARVPTYEDDFTVRLLQALGEVALEVNNLHVLFGNFDMQSLTSQCPARVGIESSRSESEK